MKKLLLTFLFSLFLAMPIFADDNPLEISLYGSFLHTEKVPDALFFFSKIEKNDSFELRKALRNHKINKIILSSRGGSVFEGLQMGAIIHDKALTTYIPNKGLDGNGDCASACSFMFFGGETRVIGGKLGVHMFFSEDANTKANVNQTQKNTQYTSSEIIGFLNEFGTPPFVYEKMFAQSKMYYFNKKEVLQLERQIDVLGNDEIKNIESFIEDLIKTLQMVDSKEAQVVTNKIPDSDKKLKPSQNEIIKMVQTEMNRIGCKLGDVDGVLGPASKQALNKFNIANKSSFSINNFFTALETVRLLEEKPADFCQETEDIKVINLTSGYSFISRCGNKSRRHSIWFRPPDLHSSDSNFIPITVKNSFTIEDLNGDSVSKYGLGGGGYTGPKRVMGWAHVTSTINTYRFEIFPSFIKKFPKVAALNGMYIFSDSPFGRRFSSTDIDGCIISGKPKY